MLLISSDFYSFILLFLLSLRLSCLLGVNSPFSYRLGHGGHGHHVLMRLLEIIVRVVLILMLIIRLPRVILLLRLHIRAIVSVSRPNVLAIGKVIVPIIHSHGFLSILVAVFILILIIHVLSYV